MDQEQIKKEKDTSWGKEWVKTARRAVPQTTEDTFKTDDRAECQVLQRRQVRQRQKLDFTTSWWPFPELIQGAVVMQQDCLH